MCRAHFMKFIAHIFDKKNNKLIITTDKAYMRQTETNLVVGDATKANIHLGWTLKHSFDSLITDMVEADLKRYPKN